MVQLAILEEGLNAADHALFSNPRSTSQNRLKVDGAKPAKPYLRILAQPKD